MDFFVDGGFQQLFNDLDDELMESEQYFSFEDNNLSTKLANAYESSDFHHPNLEEDEFQEDNKLYSTYPILSSIDSNNNGNYFPTLNHLNQLHSESNSPLSSTDSQIRELDDIMVSLENEHVTDLSDWEIEFLDDFIEIPELIDFKEHGFTFNQENNNKVNLNSNNPEIYQEKPPDLSSLNPSQLGYLCTFGTCNKIYAKPAHLKAHLRRHLGEKPYVCTWQDCTWKFSRSDELARHRRSHSGVKPYKCDYCAKCFARSDHLTKHRKVHERRLLAASKAGKTLNGILPTSVLTVRPGRRKKNQI